MSLIVEDGNGLATAESYVSVVDADAYHLALGNTAWAAASLSDKEIALRRGTQYIDARYSFRSTQNWPDSQALQWPRAGYLWPQKALTAATCEAARRALSGELYSDQDSAAVVSETIGPISITYGSQRFGGQVRFSIIDDLLARLTAGGSSGIRIERAS